ncbi:TetR/AcrR family transcriptional regulator [Actinoplanes sp. NPDC023936]|uniref:TetR/AcrR family transcriptional regulator n=1 Tax=Actinoplanes sp. NPDC023936 TaxID=3154910 RepID=UPI003408A56B
MPRVSEQHRATRRAEIITAAVRLFATNGFHATTMADIIGAAGLSAGAVYRYFSSKEELIAAVAEEALAAADETFRDLLADGAAPPPGRALAAILAAINDRIADHPATGFDLTRIGVQVWAEALRSPAVAVRVDEVYRRLRGNFAEVARRWTLPAGTDPEQVGAAMLGLAQGFVVQRLLLAGTDTTGYLAGVTALLAPEDGRHE